MVSVRRATPADHPWIASLLLSGAREGHFSATIGQQAPRMLRDIATYGGITLLKARNGRVEPRTVRVDVWVAETSGAPAAFLLCMEDVDGYELNLGGTRPEFRRRRCFDALVDHAIDAAPSASRIYARCYKASGLAMAALQRRGFVITTPGDPDELTLQPRSPVMAPVADTEPTLPVEIHVRRSWWRRAIERFRPAR
jgi:hypothetical protein